MTILYLVSRFPFPLEKGDKLRAFHQIKELSKQHEVILFAINEKTVKNECLEELKPYCKEIHVEILSRNDIIRNLSRTFFNSKPFQVGYFYKKNIDEKLKDLAHRIKPDVVYCQLIRMAEYARSLEADFKILDYMDVFSKGMERMVQRTPHPMKRLIRSEHQRLLQYEKEVFDDFNEKIIISRQDGDLIPHAENEHIHVVPNGVDFDYYKPVNRTKTYDLIFMGNMAYPPNVETALFIGRKVMPLLLKKIPEAKLVIAGATPAPSILALANKNIVVTGWVDDMREVMASSKIHIAPMLISIGLQNKILQAMAMKIPCIISELANNAVQAPASCVLTAESSDPSPEEYVEKIVYLLKNEKAAANLAENAFHFVKENFCWQKAGTSLENIIQRQIAL
ncbi:MAG: glycosyltransferase [Bacteroidia bacterium]